MSISTNELLKSWQKGSSKWTKASSLGVDCKIIHLFLLLMPVCLPEEGWAVPLPAQGSQALPLAGAWAFPQNAQSPEATSTRPDGVLTYVGINRQRTHQGLPSSSSVKLSEADRDPQNLTEYFFSCPLKQCSQARCFWIRVWLSLTWDTTAFLFNLPQAFWRVKVLQIDISLYKVMYIIVFPAFLWLNIRGYSEETRPCPVALAPRSLALGQGSDCSNGTRNKSILNCSLREWWMLHIKLIIFTDTIPNRPQCNDLDKCVTF